MDNVEINKEAKADHKVMKKYYVDILSRLLITFVAMGLIQLIIIITGVVIPYIINMSGKTVINVEAIDAYLTYVGIAVADLSGVLIFFILTRKCDKSKVQDYQNFSFIKLIWMLFCTYGVVGLGMIIGNTLSFVIYLPFKGFSTLSLSSIDRISCFAGQTGVSENSWGYLLFSALVIGIIGPVAEELIFRKFLMDHLCKYGVSAAIVISALLFGFYHGNVKQLFYTFMSGIIWGAIYAYTGKIRYTIFIHIFLNSYQNGLMSILHKCINKDVFKQLAEYAELATQGIVTNQEFFEMNNRLILDNPLTMVCGILYLVSVAFNIFLMVAGLIAIIVFAIGHIRKKELLVKGEDKSIKTVLFNRATYMIVCFCSLLFIIEFINNIFF